MYNVRDVLDGKYQGKNIKHTEHSNSKIAYTINKREIERERGSGAGLGATIYKNIEWSVNERADCHKRQP